jgi:glycosyltransferase involved in cell wall biosynthesis
MSAARRAAPFQNIAMTTAPLVTVGLPTYNSEQWLASTIDSILEQDLTDLELIVSDNASTDASHALLQKYAARDPRIRLFRQDRNIGAPANYRFVAHQARGRYFKWTASSDLVSANYLAECVRVLEECPQAVVSYGRTKLFAESPGDGRDYDDAIDLRMSDPVERFDIVLERLQLNNAINGVIRRDALLRTSIMPNFYSCDCVVLAELAILGLVLQSPAAIFYRRMNEQTATRLKSDDEKRIHSYPERRPGMLFQEWQLCAGYFSLVRRAPVTSSQRLRLLQRALKMCFWKVPRLIRDVVHAGRYLVGGRA